MVVTRCVCEICTCGRHHCPHQPLGFRATSNQRIPCTLSEYRETYKEPPPNCQQLASFKPQPRPHSSHGKLEATTTMQHDYRQHEVHPPGPPQPVTYVPPKGIFPGREDTEYCSKYPAKKVDLTATHYPKDRIRRPTVPLDTETEVRKQFVEWPLPKRQPITGNWMSEARPTIAMDLQTTTGLAYNKKEAKRPELARPPQAMERSKAPLADDTVHKSEYIPKHVPVKFSKAPPSDPTGAKAPFQTLSTTHSTYHGHSGDHRAASCKPAPNVERTVGNFNGSTTYSTGFQAWKEPKPHLEHRIEAYQPPRAQFDDQTTHGRTYIDHGTPQVRGIARPPSRLRTQSEPLLAVTTQKHDFKEWAVPRQQLIKFTGGPRKPPGKFYGESTTKSEYQGKQCDRQASFKPQSTAISSQEPFPKNTHYTEAYNEKKVGVCPVLKLRRPQSAGSGVPFSFSHQSGGHTYYTPTAVTVSHLDLTKVS